MSEEGRDKSQSKQSGKAGMTLSETKVRVEAQAANSAFSRVRREREVPVAQGTSRMCARGWLAHVGVVWTKHCRCVGHLVLPATAWVENEEGGSILASTGESKKVQAPTRGTGSQHRRGWRRTPLGDLRDRAR